MIPLNRKQVISVGQANDVDLRRVFSIRLSDEIIAKAKQSGMKLELNGEMIGALSVANERWPVSGMRESQPVDLASYATTASKLLIKGQVVAKLSVKQEMAQAKADSIRQHAEQAERDRLARK